MHFFDDTVGSMLCFALDTFPNSFVATLFVELRTVPDSVDNSFDNVHCVHFFDDTVGSMLCFALDTFPNSFVDTLFVGLGSVPDSVDNSFENVHCVHFFFHFLEGKWVIFSDDNLPTRPSESWSFFSDFFDKVFDEVFYEVVHLFYNNLPTPPLDSWTNTSF